MAFIKNNINKFGVNSCLINILLNILQLLFQECISTKIGREFKRSGMIVDSPDVREYPFVLGFRTKDIARQQEYDLKNARILASERKTFKHKKASNE